MVKAASRPGEERRRRDEPGDPGDGAARGGGRLVDGTGREVALTDRGDWGYGEDAR